MLVSPDVKTLTYPGAIACCGIRLSHFCLFLVHRSCGGFDIPTVFGDELHGRSDDHHASRSDDDHAGRFNNVDDYPTDDYYDCGTAGGRLGEGIH